MRRLLGPVFGLLLACGCGGAPQAPRLQTFRSTGAQNGFRVRYPASWHRLGNAGDVLDIVNFPTQKWTSSYELPQAGALISAVPAPEGMPSVEDWIGKVGLHFKLLANREIPLPNPPPPGSCTRLVEAQWEFRQSPSAPTVMTAYYCSTQAGLFRVELTNREGNPHQAELQSVALDIARSLRSSSNSPKPE